MQFEKNFSTIIVSLMGSAYIEEFVRICWKLEFGLPYKIALSMLIESFAELKPYSFNLVSFPFGFSKPI